MKKAAFFLGVIISLITINGFSQDGSRDFSFGDNGVVITNILDQEENENNALASAQDPNGRIIVAGFLYTDSGDQDFVIAYLEDGSIDTSFGDNGIIFSDLEFTFIDRMLIQSDGKIILGKGSGDNLWLKRILPNGVIDETFGDNGYLTVFETGGYSVGFVLTSEDKILISGKNNNNKFELRQFLENGDLDLSFGQSGAISYDFGDISTQPHGNIEEMEEGNFMVGFKIIDSGVSSNIMVKFNENGDVDTSYGIDGIITNPISGTYTCAPLVFTNGDVLSRCQYWDSNIDEYVRSTVKFHSDGSIDTNFGNNGYFGKYLGEFIQGNQRILHAEKSYDWEGGLYIGLSRYFANGTLDSSFNFESNGIVLGPARTHSLNSGKILIAGSNIWYDWPVNIVLQQFNNSPLGVSDYNFKNVSIYPNPSKNIFTIKHDMIDDELNYQVSDVLGKIILTGKMDAIQTYIDLSKAQTGMYFLNIQGNSYRLIKE